MYASSLYFKMVKKKKKNLPISFVIEEREKQREKEAGRYRGKEWGNENRKRKVNRNRE